MKNKKEKQAYNIPKTYQIITNQMESCVYASKWSQQASIDVVSQISST